MLKIDVAANELKSFCKTFASTEGTRPYLEGIFLTAHKGKLFAIATDGAMLGVMKLAENGTAFAAVYPNGVIIPSAVIADLKTRPNANIGAILELSGNEIMFKLSTGSGTVGRAIDGTYPDWTRVVPETINQEPARYTADNLLALDKFTKAISAQSFQIGFNGTGPAWVEFVGAKDCFAVVMPYKNNSAFPRPDYI